MNEMYTAPPDAPRESKGFAIASMVLGIVSVVFSCCFYYVALPCGVVGFILGLICLINKRPGRGMAIAGIVTSSVALVLAILLIIFSAAILSAFPMEDWADFLNSYS